MDPPFCGDDCVEDSTGRLLALSGPSGLDITATYRDAVGLGTGAPVGDLFARLDLQFTSAGGFGSGNTLTFEADTDNAAAAGDIVPQVPEPGTLTLLGFGLAGLAARAKRRSRA